MTNSASCDSCGQPHGMWATDRLTSLLDRWGWDARASEILASSPSTALVVLDLDNFKRVNDRYGHVAGDAVLKAVAGTLRRNTRKGDLLGRYGGHGGDEFLVMLPDTGKDEARGVADRVRRDLRDLIVHAPTNGGTVRLDRITASFGVAVGIPGMSLESLVVAADEALRRAKRTGRDRVRTPGRFSLRIPLALIGACAAGVVVAALAGSDAPGTGQVSKLPQDMAAAPEIPTVTLPPVTVPTTVTMTATVRPKPQAPVVLREQPKQTTTSATTSATTSGEAAAPRELQRPSEARRQCTVCDMMDAAISDYMRSGRRTR
jgi:diguanylate cyclase (GGDEF)-like protein